jgi:hypothetical protein
MSLRAGAVNARRPRQGGVPNVAGALGCQCAVEGPAKSIDGAEHSGMIKRVMAVARIDSQVRRTFYAVTVPRSWF